MGQFLGYPNLIKRTHKFFQKSLIYYNDRPELMTTVANKVINKNPVFKVCWEGQDGGPKGLRQKGWSIVSLLVIAREARLRSTRVKVLAKGYNQVISS